MGEEYLIIFSYMNILATPCSRGYEFYNVGKGPPGNYNNGFSFSQICIGVEKNI